MLPLRLEAIAAALADRPEFGGYVGESSSATSAAISAASSSTGGETPLWDALGPALVEEQTGDLAGRSTPSSWSAPPSRRRADAALPRRLLPGARQHRRSRRRRRADRVEQTAIPTFRDHGFSTVDDIDTIPARRARCSSPATRIRATTASRHRDERPAADRAACRRPGEGAADDPRRGPRRGSADRRRPWRRCGSGFREAEVLVADDGSRDATAERRRGGRRTRAPAPAPRQRAGADARPSARRRRATCSSATPTSAATCGRCSPGDADVDVAIFAQQQGGGFGIAKGVARRLIRARVGLEAREPLSGQRAPDAGRARRSSRSPPASAARRAMTIDASARGLRGRGGRAPARAPRHRPRPRRLPPPRPPAARHRARLRPAGRNFRGLRLPLVGWLVGVAQPSVAAGGRDRARRRPLERGGARVPRAPRVRGGRRASSSSSGSRLRPARDADALRRAARRARRERSSTSSTRGRAARSRPTSPAAVRARSAARDRRPARFPTIFARWRCSGTRGRTRSAPC